MSENQPSTESAEKTVTETVKKDEIQEPSNETTTKPKTKRRGRYKRKPKAETVEEKAEKKPVEAAPEATAEKDAVAKEPEKKFDPADEIPSWDDDDEPAPVVKVKEPEVVKEPVVEKKEAKAEEPVKAEEPKVAGKEQNRAQTNPAGRKHSRPDSRGRSRRPERGEKKPSGPDGAEEKVREEKVREEKAREDKTREDKSREEKAPPQRPGGYNNQPQRQKSENGQAHRRPQGSRPDRSARPAAAPSPAANSGGSLQREMLINISQGEECRIAIVADHKLDELYVERLSTASVVGNIYKGKVVNMEPSIQACFVDFGIGQNGFLHISDVMPTYFKNGKRESERVGQKRPRDQRPPIQDCFKRGDEVVVQVIKAGIGTKGPTLSTYLSIPGRFLVMMPGMNRTGISRKIEDDETRDKMRELIRQLDLPRDMGFILRTAALGSTKRDIRADYSYLMRLWKRIEEKTEKQAAPCELYQESDLISRTLRDVFNSSINRIVCDSEYSWKKARDFLAIAMPRSKQKVIRHEGKQPLFSKYRIEQEIEQIQSRHVPLKIGGSIVIDQTEAMVAIDVNSGKYRVHENAEETALKINMEAASEIARQLRLRDLGGVIVMDFIDMMQARNRRAVEKALRDAVAADRASTKILRMSQFGLIEMTRQRMKPSLKRSIYIDCPHCKGSGLIKSPESMSIEVMRRLQFTIEMETIQQIDISVSLEVAGYLQNRKRTAIAALEKKYDKGIFINANPDISNDEVRFHAHDRRGIEVPIDF